MTENAQIAKRQCPSCGREGLRGFSPDGACTNAEACAERTARRERAKLRGRCIDCLAEGVATVRPAPKPGPRCVSHHRVIRDQRKLSAHGAHLESKFRITSAQYWALYALQGGRCFICQRATGKARRLAVEHDHLLAASHDHPVDEGCIECIRCLACGPCNVDVLGRLDVAALIRAIVVLTDPPARKWLAVAAVTVDEVMPDDMRAALDFWAPTSTDDFWSAPSQDDWACL